MRFTIRDLLWLMVVVGFASGWWNAEKKRIKSYDQSLRRLEAENNELLHAQGRLTDERDGAVEESNELLRAHGRLRDERDKAVKENEDYRKFGR